MPHNNLQPQLNTECSTMKSDKRTVRKRLSKFISKVLCNFNQAAPIRSSNNGDYITAVDTHTSSFHGHQQTMAGIKNYPMPFGSQYRRRSSALRRTSTLTSIKEENEIEVMHCT
ncbi:unnamed protein product [Rotaria magnacalcarata]|uniref:Uncharacterized protein n=1 Tax=Rotaria magnacalcarata TaxID=392030 RepID=A0A819SK95_9BILA|nr:unnamed protein product [Rotaria magnacalcarata]CAF2020915.1 unnamed protein product [Rotaria magnacalcarata]CAF2059668.1 unnamed protein product [Rotaria magnacalcarata]CAF4060966.1 unnamed protein product [Rotaria magnacalcarata]CAF4116500.1 unnamed protein product [Rotaria magnacalcarata]